MAKLQRYSIIPIPTHRRTKPTTHPRQSLHLDGPPFGLERIWDYERGGHHPLHLGATLGEKNQYRIIHKLGNGRFANIWLCRVLTSTIPTYVALKIFMADFSDWECPELRVNRIREVGAENDSICLPLDQFQVTGPNGSHFCFVYPVGGPKVSCILQEFEEPDQVLRRVGLNAVKAMATLHRFGICHGDFTPSNILLRVSGLDGLPEDEVIQILGVPKTVNVVTSTGEKSSHPSAPPYLVHPVDFQSVHHRYLSDEIYIIDFGKSYHVSLPPDDLDIPQNYYSPELILDGKTGIGSDLWALGCTLFAIRTGRKLFDLFDDDRDDHLHHMVMLLGILPEPWWTSTWSTRIDYFDDRPSSKNRAVKAFEALDEPAEPHEPRSIEEMLDHGLVYIESRTGMIPKEVRRKISAEEVTMFADLLGLILRYQPEERLTADLAQHHGWFSM